MVTVRKGQAPATLGRDEFHLVFHRSFMDPAFEAVGSELAAIEEIAWDNYQKAARRLSPRKPDPALPTLTTTCLWNGAPPATG